MAVAAPRDADGVEDRRRQVHVLHQRVARERPGGRQGGGIADDHRDLDGLLPRVVLAGPAMLAVDEAVVGEIDDHRVLRAVAERPEQRSDRVVERARGVRHGRVVLVGRRDLLLGERRPARVQRGRGRHGVGVERRSSRRRHGHVRVPGVVGREVRRRRRVHHEERLVRGRVLDEVGRQVLQHVRLVAGLALPDPVDVHHGIDERQRGDLRGGDAGPTIELGARIARPAVHVLAGQHRAVPSVVERHRERRPRQHDLVLVDAGVVLVEAGDDLRPRGTAQRRVHVRPLEQDPLVDQLAVDAGHQIAGERRPRLVVAHDQQDVRVGGPCRGG